MRISLIRPLTIACVLFAAASSLSAQTVVLDFEEVVCPPPDVGFGGVAIPAGYSFGGYSITTTAVESAFRPHQTVWCSNNYNYAGSQAWFVNYIGSSTSRLFRPDGGRFAIESISLATMLKQEPSAAGPITFVGTLGQGGVVTQTFNVPFLANLTFSPFLFGSEFSNLTALEWTSGTIFPPGPNTDLASVQIDNIALSTTTVPEPGTVALLTIGLVGLYCRRRVRVLPM